MASAHDASGGHDLVGEKSATSTAAGLPCLRRTWPIAAAVGLLGAAAMLARLFLGGTVGMADNFDGIRLTCQLGLIRHPTVWHRFEYVGIRYDRHTWSGETCGLGGAAYLTTERYLLDAAGWISPLLGHDWALDLRALGVVCALVFGAGLAALVACLPHPPRIRVLVAVLVALATLDSVVALYNISPLSEPAAVLGVLVAVAMMFRVAGRDRPRGIDLVLLAAAAAWTVLAKTQTAPILIPVLPVLLARPVSSIRWQTARPVLGRLPGAALATALILLAVWYQSATPQWYRDTYRFHQVFAEILPHSPTPAADLRDLGLPEQWTKYSGDRIYGSGLARNLDEYSLFQRDINTGRLLGFYADHPARLVGMADRGMTALSSAREGYLGNYLPGPGSAPYAKDCRVCLFSAAFHAAQPFRWIIFPLLWLGSMVLGLRLATNRRNPSNRRSLGLVLAGMALAALFQLWAALLTDGANDLEKHLVIAWYTTALLPAAATAALTAPHPTPFRGLQHVPPTRRRESASRLPEASAAPADAVATMPEA